jgi:hypothetical protein
VNDTASSERLTPIQTFFEDIDVLNTSAPDAAAQVLDQCPLADEVRQKGVSLEITSGSSLVKVYEGIDRADHGSGVEGDFDQVSVLELGERRARGEGLGRNVTEARSGGDPGEPGVGDKSAVG